MDTITETPSTDIVTIDEAAQTEEHSTNSFGKEVTKTILVSIATTAVLAGGTFAASYAVEKVKQLHMKRLLKKLDAAVDAPVIEMKPENPTKED